jgi:type I restriction enzyme, S subunit
MSKKSKKNVPRLRFPEFEGDWEQAAIEDIALVSSGGTPSRSEPSFWNGDIPWVTTSEIGQSEIYESGEK